MDYITYNIHSFINLGRYKLLEYINTESFNKEVFTYRKAAQNNGTNMLQENSVKTNSTGL